MELEYGINQKILLKPADMFVMKHMLGLICQGHGPVRTRGIIAAVIYMRLAYDLTLRDAHEVVRLFEAKTPRQP